MFDYNRIWSFPIVGKEIKNNNNTFQTKWA